MSCPTTPRDLCFSATLSLSYVTLSLHNYKYADSIADETHRLQDSGRLSVPYVMLYYLPITCNSEVKMLYAGAKELMRNTSEVGRIIEIDSAEDLEEIEEKLKEQ